jgi:hypothetical protein
MSFGESGVKPCGSAVVEFNRKLHCRRTAKQLAELTEGSAFASTWVEYGEWPVRWRSQTR